MNTREKNLSIRRELVSTADEDRMLNDLCAARRDDKGTPSRNSVIRALIREEHTRLAAAKETTE